MAKVRKLVAALLAVLMVFGSLSVMASAWDATVDDGFALGLSAKMFRQVNGQWVETTKVSPGENVKARVYLDTDYFTYSGNLLMFYNTDFFEDSYSSAMQTLSVNNKYKQTPYGVSGVFLSSANTATALISRMVSNDCITQEFADSHNFFQVSYEFSTASTTQELDGSVWFCEFDLKVKADATGTGEFVFVRDTCLSSGNQSGYIDVPKGQQGTKTAYSMHLWEPVIAINNAQVSLFTNLVTLTFNANSGIFDAADQAKYVAQGDAGDPVAALPTLSRDGYVFAGWSDSSITNPTAADYVETPTSFPSASVTYNAQWVPEGGVQAETSLRFETKFFRLDAESGQWIPTTRVAPGEQVKARLYVDTDYYTNSGEIIMFYDNDFFTDAYKGSQINAAANFNTAPGSDAAQFRMEGSFSCTNSNARQAELLVDRGYITPEYLDSHGFFALSFNIANNLENQKLTSGLLTADESDDNWLFEVDLTVLETASGTGDIVIEPNTVDNTTTRQTAYVNIPKGEEGTVGNTVGMWLWDAQTTIASNPVSVDSKITLNANGGVFAADDTATYETTGVIGSAYDADAVPAITRPGFSLAGWVDASIEEPTLADAGPLPTVYPYEDAEYNAFWLTDVTITIDNANGDALITRDVTPYEPFEAVETPTFEGYFFIGWNPAIPATYPDVDTTYTAVWEKETYTVRYFVLDPNTMTFTKVCEGPVEYASPVDTDIVTYTVPEGYSISGAYSDIGFETPFADNTPMPANNLDLYYKIGAKTYDAVFYRVEGDTVAYATVPTVYDTAIQAPADPTREGYVFTGWLPVVGTMDSEGKTFVAAWQANEYTIDYMVDGEVYNTYTVACGDELDVSADPDKTGYEFLGWAETEGGAVVTLPATMPAQDLTYYAVFQAQIYTITLDAGDGSFDDGEAVKTIEGEFGSTVTAPADPTRTGYDFAGWADSDENPVDIPATMPADGLDLHAVWDVKSYKVDYIVDGAVAETYDVEFGAAVPAAGDTPIKDGYTFEGWTPAAPATMPAEDIEFTAVFSINSYDVIFDGNGGYFDGDTNITSKTESCEYNSAIVFPTSPVMQGYVFNGWTPANITTVPVDGVTFTAQWIPATDTPYTIKTYVMATDGTYGDALVTNATGTTGTQVSVANVLDTVPNGFYVDTATSTLTDIVAADGSTVLTVYYARNSYEIIFDCNGGTSDGNETVTNNYFHGASVSLPTTPVLEGYTFTGWDPTVDSTAIASVTYTAQWAVNSYTITYYNGNAVFAVDTFDYNAATTLNAGIPTKTGYTFDAWVDASGDPFAAPANMPAENLEAYATFTPNSYDATFNAGEGYFNNDPADHEEAVPVEFDADITAPADPVRPGYDFDGWSTDGTTVIDPLGTMDTVGGEEFTAVWTAQQQDYYIDIYTMGTDGTYGAPSRTTRQAATDETVSYTPTIPVGFYVDYEAPNTSVLEGVIPATGNLVLTAYRARYKHTLTTDVDRTITDVEYYFGANVTVEEPTKAGYDFAGWVDRNGDPVVAPATMPNSDVLLIATWTVKSFNIKYDANGGKFAGGAVIVQIPVDFNAVIPTQAAPTREGYTFTGWSENIPVLMPNNDIDVAAQWSINSYDAVFYSDGNTAYETIAVEYNAAITAPATAPTKTGYTFAGWADIAAPTEVLTSLGNMTTDGAEFIAVWTANNNTKFIVRSHYYDFTLGEEKTEDTEFFGITGANAYIVENIPSTEEPNAYYVLYDLDIPTYAGQSTDKTAGIHGVIAADGSLVLDVYYTVDKYVITFNAAPGAFADTSTSVSTDPLDYNTLIVAPENDPTREGYDFVGWIGFTEGTTRVTGTRTFTASWSIAQFKATFDAGEGHFGEDAANHTYTDTEDYGTDIMFPADPTRTGYNFMGWVDANDNPVTAPKEMPGEDVTYTATWDAQTYTVTYMSDGNTVFSGPTDVDFGVNIPVPDTAPTKVNYVFSHWEDEAGNAPSHYGTMPDKDLTFTAVFVANASIGYTVNVYEMKTDGTYPTAPTSVISHTDGTIGESRAVIPTPAMGFVTDTAASTLSGVIPTPPATLVLSVYYARVEYTLTTTVDGVVTAVDYLYGAAVTPIADPEKDGYVFTGWVDNNANDANVPAVMPASNVDLTATFNKNSFPAVFSAGEGQFASGEASETVLVEFEAPITAPAANPTRDGYTFAGWAIPSAPETVITDYGNMTSAGAEFVAVWDVSSFTVTFYNYVVGPATSHEMTVYYTTTLAFGEEIQFPENPGITHYVFKGWKDTEGDAEGNEYAPGATMPGENLNLYAIYERVKVMLIPKSTDNACTTVIDRQGLDVENYTEGTQDWYVYGLEEYLTKDLLLSKYVAVQGDGFIVVNEVPRQGCGTGTVIQVYDRVTSELVESFYIVIFGDVNGDARFTTEDYVIIRDEIMYTTNWSRQGTEEYVPYLLMAADTDQNGYIEAVDTTNSRGLTVGGVVVDQVTGLATAYQGD